MVNCKLTIFSSQSLSFSFDPASSFLCRLSYYLDLIR
jgi:hypothetical protein